MNFHLGSPKTAINKLMIASKNYVLYPEDHIIQEKTLKELMAPLETFFENNANLPLKVEKGKLIFGEEVVHQGPMNEENPAFQLYRDGIESLILHQGIEKREIQTLLKILKLHKTRNEAAEGDITTALWEAELPHLTYETTNVFWEKEPLIDFSEMKAMDQTKRGLKGRPTIPTDVASIADMGVGHTLWELNPLELQKTLALIREEEKRDFDTDLFDMLLIMLKEQRGEDDFAEVLNHMAEFFQNILAKGKFCLTTRLLNHIHYLYLACKEEQDWAIPYLEDFFIIISSNRVLSSLHRFWPHLDPKETEQLENMHQTLLLLSPRAILTLLPMACEVSSSFIQEQLMEIVTVLAQKDIGPLVNMLNHPDEPIVQKTALILGKIQGEETTQALVRLLKSPSESIRFAAVKALVKRTPLRVQDLFPLIQDSCRQIRQLVLEHLGKKRDETAETMLLANIENGKHHRKNRQFLLDLYGALGGCGSSRSVPFLKEKLLHHALISGFGRSVHRQGAALALLKLETDDSREILFKAAKSPYPSIRNACKKIGWSHKDSTAIRAGII